MQQPQEAQILTSTATQPAGSQAQHAKTGSASVGAWLTQSLAAIKRRSRSTDDGQPRTVPPSNGNVDFDEQTQVLVYSHASQPLPAGTQSDALAAPDTAQHVQQAVQVKRKRGRPRKVPLKPGPVPAASPISLLLSSTGAGTGAMQQTNGPHSLPDAQITLNPAAPASQSSAAEAAVPAMPAVPAVPAGALMPHKRNSTSGQTDTGKLPKSRSKAQLPTSSMVLAHRIASGAIVPESTNTVLAGAQPTYPPAHHTAAAAESAETAAAAAVAMAAVVSPKTGAEDEAAAAVVTAAGLETGPESGRTAAALDSEAASVSESKGGREPATEDCKQASAAEVTGSPVWMGSTAAAQWQQLPDASAATLSGLRSPTASSGKKEHGDASKPAVAISEAQSTADQQLGSTSNKPSHSAAVASATAAPFEAPLPHTVPVYTHASTVEGHPTSNGGSSIEAEGRAAGQTQQGQEGGETDSLREGGPGSGLQSHNLVLPLSLLLNGGLPVKKRGRPYKNAATAEKAAQREARRAAHDAAEKAAYQAASEAAQVVIAAPPVKKRRGRPPKDPAKLAAALAAYHANTQARQASVDAERGFAGLDTVMEAAQAAAAQASASAAAAAAAAGQPAAVSAPLVDMGGSAPPPPAQKKRGRPSRSIAKAVGDALQTLSGSLATANGSSNNHFLESFRSADFDGNDDDQALLDAAAVLTSDLPFPQGVREQAEPLEQAMSRQPKGKRKSGAHANAAAQSGTAASHGRRGRRGLELVSSRATALLDSIGPDLHGPGEAAPPPRPHPGLLQRTGAPVGPSNPDPPPPLGFSHPPKRQRRDGHSSQQPATAASGSTENRPQSALTHAPSPPSPRHRTASDAGNDIKHALADDPSAVAMPTATASSPNHPAAEPVPAPDAATEGTSSAASPLLNGASSSLGPERHSEDKPRQTQVQQQQQQQQHSAQISHQVDEEEAAQQKPAADDYSADDAVAYEALLQQQAAEEVSQGRATAPKGNSPLLKGRASPVKGTDTSSAGKDEPFSQTSSGGIQPPVMLAHLAHSKAAGLRESLKQKLKAGHELESLPARLSSSSNDQSAQPRLQGSSAALMAVEDRSRQPAEVSQQQQQQQQQPEVEHCLHPASPSSQPSHQQQQLPVQDEHMPGAEPSSEPADLQQQSPAQEQHLLSDQALSKSHHQQLQAAEEQQQLHEAEPLLVPAHQHQQAVLQQPVLALLSSGLPPIVLGTFQGDMQRARIILEAAGFLIPLDASSSLLPPGIAPCLPQQHAAPAVLHAEHAALRSNQTAVLASGHGDATVPGDEAAGMMPATADLQLTNVRQAASQGASLRGSHRRKQRRGGEQAARDVKTPKSPQHLGDEKPKRGRPSSVRRQAAAAAATEAHVYSDDGGRVRSPQPPHPGQECLSQEEWQRLGFRGEFQGTGQLQDALQQQDYTLAGSNTGSGPPHRRKTAKAHVKLGRSAKRSRTDRDPADGLGSPPDSAGMDAQQPHVPRRKRSRASDLIRPLEVLAAAKAAAKAASVARVSHVQQDDCTSDPLGSPAAAAAAESESDAELAKSPEQGGGRTTHMSQSGYTSPSEGVQRTHDEDARRQQKSHEFGGRSRPAHEALPANLVPAGPLHPRIGQTGGEALVGRLVAKRFGSHPALFKGKVGYYAPRLCPRAPFHIQYEDGDSEDLPFQEVVAILV